jgi:hypothetical protein
MTPLNPATDPAPGFGLKPRCFIQKALALCCRFIVLLVVNATKCVASIADSATLKSSLSKAVLQPRTSEVTVALHGFSAVFYLLFFPDCKRSALSEAAPIFLKLANRSSLETWTSFGHWIAIHGRSGTKRYINKLFRKLNALKKFGSWTIGSLSGHCVIGHWSFLARFGSGYERFVLREKLPLSHPVPRCTTKNPRLCAFADFILENFFYLNFQP